MNGVRLLLWWCIWEMNSSWKRFGKRSAFPLWDLVPPIQREAPAGQSTWRRSAGSEGDPLGGFHPDGAGRLPPGGATRSVSLICDITHWPFEDLEGRLERGLVINLCSPIRPGGGGRGPSSGGVWALRWIKSCLRVDLCQVHTQEPLLVMAPCSFHLSFDLFAGTRLLL